MIHTRHFAFFAVAVVAAWFAGAATLEGKVTRVSDGDTIWVTTKDGPRESKNPGIEQEAWLLMSNLLVALRIYDERGTLGL